MRRAAAFLEEYAPRLSGGMVLCAVSGGRDSMVLLHLLHTLAVEQDFHVAAAHFNHRLRPTADRDEALVRDWCRERGIPLETGRGDVRAFAAKAGTGVEDAARQLRYRFLEEAADRLGAQYIATAHHREDNAETVLLHLLRGTGLRGLCGIPPARGRILRPLLDISREEINAYAAAHGIPYGEDETNADPAYTRNRLRLEVLPLLEEISPGCAGRIAGTASLLREEEEHLRREAERSCPVSYGVDSVTLTGVWSADAVPGRRQIRSAARRFGVELDRRSTENLWTLSNGGTLDLPGGLRAFRTGNRLTLQKQPEAPAPMVLHPGPQSWGPWLVQVEQAPSPPEPEAHRVILRQTEEPLTIARWDGTGRLAVENGSRSIKRLFVDKNIPVGRRREHPALYLGETPIAVFGIAVDHVWIPGPGEPCTVISLSPGREKCAGSTKKS